jgi:RNase P subunit RPR2
MPDEVSITCPACGTTTELSAPLRRSADEFCVNCDYPLFWAPTAPTSIGAAAGGPGVADSSCRRCGHVNPNAARFCNMCGEALDE